MKRSADYQAHLNKVSRSFAFCIAELREPLRSWVGLSYILFRIVDTIEDSVWADRRAQLDSLEQVKNFGQHLSGDFEFWRSQLPPGIDPSEMALFNEAEHFFSDLHSLPEDIRTIISKALVQMVDGMSHFLSETPANQSLSLRTLPEVNQYCFFVAGIIGELLTELVFVRTDKIATTSELWTDSVHFGLFLQKVNLLKDQRRDETEGRFLVPSREEFKRSLWDHSDGAFRYLTKIPNENVDYRLFCAWSLFLGLASLTWIEKSWQGRRDVKLPRLETMALVARIKSSINDSNKLFSLFQELRTLSPSSGTKASAGVDLPAWFKNCYSGRIHAPELISLGLA